MKSDGTPWRPLVHIEDIARAFVAIARGAARRSCTTRRSTSAARTENYQIRDVAQIVEEVVPGARSPSPSGAEPDKRNYRVNCDKHRRGAAGLPAAVDGAARRRGALRGLHQVRPAARGELHGGRLSASARSRELLDAEQLVLDLRWASVPA